MPSIDGSLVQLVAARFKALGDPGRLALLQALLHGERSVAELVADTGRSQPNVSQHLASLARAGFVAARREGNRAYYSCVDPCVTEICEAVCRSLTERMRADAERVGIAVRKGRKSLAKARA
jgi:DNA-binding transcriptional ArsR family regulator